MPATKTSFVDFTFVNSFMTMNLGASILFSMIYLLTKGANSYRNISSCFFVNEQCDASISLMEILTAPFYFLLFSHHIKLFNII